MCTQKNQYYPLKNHYLKKIYFDTNMNRGVINEISELSETSLIGSLAEVRNVKAVLGSRKGFSNCFVFIMIQTFINQ